MPHFSAIASSDSSSRKFASMNARALVNFVNAGDAVFTGSAASSRNIISSWRVINEHSGAASSDLRTPRSINWSKLRRIGSLFKQRTTMPGWMPHASRKAPTPLPVNPTKYLRSGLVAELSMRWPIPGP